MRRSEAVGSEVYFARNPIRVWTFHLLKILAKPATLNVVHSLTFAI